MGVMNNSIICNSTKYSIWTDDFLTESNEIEANYRVGDYTNDGADVFVDKLIILDSILIFSINIDGQPSHISVRAEKVEIEGTSNEVDYYLGTLTFKDGESLAASCFVRVK